MSETGTSLQVHALVDQIPIEQVHLGSQLECLLKGRVSDFDSFVRVQQTTRRLNQHFLPQL